MSGSKKNENTEAWRENLRKLLFTACQPKKQSPIKVDLDSCERRHSMDIREDFQALIAAKKTELQKREENRVNKETVSMCEDTMIGEISDAPAPLDDQDDSFDAFERMCDKTGSDPDSTLFQYMHSNDKDLVLAQAKERSGSSRDNSRDGAKLQDLEVEALRRMFHDVNVQQQLGDESPLRGVECSQLEDVEAPSRFWDNTLMDNESLFQSAGSAKKSPSPVKMVGLLRPSTILETSEAVSDTSSQLSFHSALKRAQSSETMATSCYETADNDSLGSDKDQQLYNVDDLFYAAIAKAKPPGMSKGEQQELISDLHVSLTELMAPQDQTLQEDSIIELSSSDEEDEAKQAAAYNASIKREKPSMQATIEQDLESDKENENKSLHFNDTMEEMEYMIKKGMEYMAQGGAAAAPPPPTTTTATAAPPPLEKQHTFTKSPARGDLLQFSPLRSINKKPITPLPASGQKPSSSSSSSSKHRHAINMSAKPVPRLFKQPSSIPTRRQLELKQPYAHIVSPIRTYTQKSGTVPLMTLFRQSSTDAYQALAFTELEKESRLYRAKQNLAAAAGGDAKQRGIPADAPLLPKKAYISSETKHIVDERSPMPMPNVPKIQKYLNSAVEPAVLRHDGKIKMPGGGDHDHDHSSASYMPRRPNLSLADLSLASGDISMYTIKDAQKF